MKKKVIIGCILSALIVAGGVYAINLKSSEPTNTNAEVLETKSGVVTEKSKIFDKYLGNFTGDVLKTKKGFLSDFTKRIDTILGGLTEKFSKEMTIDNEVSVNTDKNIHAFKFFVDLDEAELTKEEKLTSISKIYGNASFNDLDESSFSSAINVRFSLTDGTFNTDEKGEGILKNIHKDLSKKYILDNFKKLKSGEKLIVEQIRSENINKTIMVLYEKYSDKEFVAINIIEDNYIVRKK